MAKTAQEIEKEFIENVKGTTGKTLPDWLKEINGYELGKRNEIMARLKSEHGLNHTQAQILAGIHLNGGKPLYGDTGQLSDALFEKKEQWKPIADKILEEAKKLVPDIKIVPTKSYLSMQNGREFAVISVKKDELRVGMDLGDVPFDDYLQPSKSLGAMPRISHMVTIKEEKQLDNKLFQHISKANERVNG